MFNFGNDGFNHGQLIQLSEKNSGFRIGQRIREVRTEQGITQAQLGARVGLNADRIQKYENGARKPKTDLLTEIAVALGVESLSLSDPVVGNYYGAMYAFFEMEKLYGLKLKRIDGHLYLTFENGSMNGYLEDWEKELNMINEELENSPNEEDRKKILHAYKLWKWNYPYADTEFSQEYLNDLRKDELKREIDKLQKELSALDKNIKKKKK